MNGSYAAITILQLQILLLTARFAATYQKAHFSHHLTALHPLSVSSESVRLSSLVAH